VITIEQEQTTPAPWVNVIANSEFGTVISESGSAYTWGETRTNSGSLRGITIRNRCKREAFFLRDEESGSFLVAITAAGSWHRTVYHPAWVWL